MDSCRSDDLPVISTALGDTDPKYFRSSKGVEAEVRLRILWIPCQSLEGQSSLDAIGSKIRQLFETSEPFVLADNQ